MILEKSILGCLTKFQKISNILLNNVFAKSPSQNHVITSTSVPGENSHIRSEKHPIFTRIIRNRNFEKCKHFLMASSSPSPPHSHCTSRYCLTVLPKTLSCCITNFSLRCFALLCAALWCSVVLCGALRCFVVLCGALWCFVVLCGALWCLVVLCGALWCFVVLCGALWCFVVLCGALWCFVVLCGALWCFVVLCGALWCFVVLCGALWCFVMGKI